MTRPNLLYVMTDQQRWYAGFFGHHHQTDGGLPNLADASWGGGQFSVVHGLNRINDQNLRWVRLNHPQNRIDFDLGNHH